MVPNFAQRRGVPPRGGREGRKRFFFEKKKQKTFIRWRRGYHPGRRVQNAGNAIGKRVKFFCFFLFTKRRLLAFQHPPQQLHILGEACIALD